MNNKITRIIFSNIRNFKDYEKKINKSVIFVGNNGVGKTSILEAISLIYGRGIRSANYEEVLNYNFPETPNWSTLIETYNGDYSSQISAEFKNNKKIIRVNGKQIKNFNEVLNYVKIIWVTQNDYHQFLISNSYRRNFFDRTIAQSITNYQNYFVKYKYCLTERTKILSLQNSRNDTWLSEIEKNLAKLNVCIMGVRNDIIQKLNNTNKNNSKFSPQMRIVGLLEEKQFSEIELIEFLKHNRSLHTQMKRSNIGIHLSKLYILNSSDSRHIEHLSSGEQRLLLNQFIINFIQIQSDDDKNKLIILLDDILTFFDEQNQNLLLKKLLDLNIQFFITTNNFKLNDEILEKIEIIDEF